MIITSTDDGFYTDILSGLDASYQAGYTAGYSGGIAHTAPSTGKIAYTHHIHSLTTKTTTEVNSSNSTSSVSGGYANNYKASASGGCFTKYVQTTGTCVHKLEYDHRHEYSVIGGRCTECGMWDVGNDAVDAHYGVGSICGQRYDIDHTHSWSDEYRHDVVTSKGYTASCGYSNGQIIPATITY